MEKKRVGAKFLLESGLLFQINRTFLHPLGLALEVEIDKKTDEVKFGGIWDCRDEPKGILFSENAFKEGYRKWKKFSRQEGEKKITERLKQLGFIIQSNKK